MFVAALKRLVVFIFILSWALFAKAQQVHFVYLQTENGQPFYVKLNNKVVSSSLAGYLILPKLVDGDYKLTVGFPKNEFPEENFQITIDKKNEGFLLKNFEDKGWGLFNMQSYGVVMGGGSNAGPVDTVSKNLQSDSFSKMLANVVKDSSILQKNEPVKEVAAPPKTDAVVTVALPVPLSLSPAKKILSEKNKDGMEMVYIDTSQNGHDTIRIFIPAENVIIKPDTPNNIAPSEKQLEPVLKDTVSVKDAPVGKDTASVKDALSMKDHLPVTDTASINESKQGSKADSVITASVPPLVSENKSSLENKDTVVVKKEDEIKQESEEVKQPAIIQQDSTIKENKKPAETRKDEPAVLPGLVKSSNTNSDCKAVADNEDFLKLRKKMASENSDDDMISVARKTFRSKCFSTEQIKNLSFLFLTNEGKYRFFDAAYAFAADSDQYFTLQSQLTDSYYSNRFGAMIHK